jgi:hypothetical protein
MPGLDDYHPMMDDYMTELLHTLSKRPKDVSIVFDNPSICCHIDNPNERSLVSLLLSEAVGEDTAKLPDDDGQQANDGLATEALNDKKGVSSLAETPKQFEDSFSSIDISKQVVTPVKDDSPISVMEVIMEPPPIRAIG